jgi:ribosome maturation factor RimP
MNGSSRRSSPRQAPAGGRVQVPAAAGAADSERLAGLLAPAVAAMGMDLEGVRVTAAGRRRLLRVVVDADGGVSLDDIALVSRELGARLDATAAMGEAPYTLEVSSPGVDRPLTEPRHWRRAVGRLVSVPLAARAQDETASSAPSASARPATIEGRVAGVGEHGVRIDVEGASREFGYAELGPGRIQIEFARLAAAGEDDPGDGADEADEEGHDGH